MSKVTFVDHTTLTTSGNLPDFVQPGAKIRITAGDNRAEVVISAMGQSPRQAYAKGFGLLLKQTLGQASKATPVEGELELAE